MEVLIILGIIYFLYESVHGKTKEERNAASIQAGKHSSKLFAQILRSLFR